MLAQILRQLYPTRRWGEPDDAAWYGAGVPEDEGRRLARHAAAVCKAPAYFRPGAEDEVCDHIYVLCVGREPGLVLYRDVEAILQHDGPSLQSGISERYLRLSLSRMVRAAALQEVVIDLDRDGDGWTYKEKPRPGVYDPILLERTQHLVDLMVQHDIIYFDFGLITKAPELYDPGEPYDASEYATRYGQAPGTVNYLFYPQPATAVSTIYLPCE